MLVKKYKFMADVGKGVTGYVSHVCIWLHVSESRLSLCRDDTIFHIVHPIPTFPFIQLNEFCPCILSSPSSITIFVYRVLGRRNLLIKFTMLSHVEIRGLWEVMLPVLLNQSEGDLRPV